MSPEKVREILELFLSIFTNEWVSAFEILCAMGLDERHTVGPVSEQIALLDDDLLGLDGKPLDECMVIDTFKDAKELFKVYWGIFKLRCAERRLILTDKEAMRIVKDAVPCEEVWQDIVAKDSDFDLFLKMKRHNQEDKQIADAKAAREEAKVKNLERQAAVRRALEKNLLKSKHAIHIDRLKVCFAEELEQVVRDLENEGVASGPHEMSQMLTELFPNIPKSLHPPLLNKYVERLRAIRDNPQPKLKGSIYRPEKIRISTVDIDHTTGSLIVGKFSLTFDAKGIVGVLNGLKDSEEVSLEEFSAEVNNLLEKIREYCQKHQIPGYQSLVAKLQKKYNEIWTKSDQKSINSLKIGVIYTSLGLMHSKLFEDNFDPKSMPEKRFKKIKNQQAC